MADNYPDKGRRKFVKTVVGAGVIGSMASAGYMSFDLLSHETGEGGGPTTFMGMEILSGPAPRGMPQIPLEITSNGEITGKAPTEDNTAVEIAGVEYRMSWFQYCGVQGYPGIDPSFESDNKFRYVDRNNWEEWHEDRKGEVMKVEHFDDWKEYQGVESATEGLGKPAWGTWRGGNADQKLPVAVIKTDKSRLLENASNERIRSWLEETCPRGFVGWLNKCTHFCCVPQGFQTTDYKNAEDKVYCQCHQSIYDPFQIHQQEFVALPRPDR